MKKYILITLLLLSIIVTLFTTTYAWFTFVQRRSVAQLTANELNIEMFVNDDILDQQLTFDQLVFIDYEADLIMNQNGLLDQIAQTLIITIKLKEGSPVSSHQIIVTSLNPALLYLITFEGKNLAPSHVMFSDYHQLFMSLISIESSKEEQLHSLLAYNQSVLDDIFETIVYPGETITIKIALWGDYNGLSSPELFDTFSDQISVDILTRSKVGGV